MFSMDSHGIMGGEGNCASVGPSGVEDAETGTLSGKPWVRSIFADSSGEEAKMLVLGSLSIPISCFGFDFAILRRKLMSVEVSAACLKGRRDCCFAFRRAFL